MIELITITQVRETWFLNKVIVNPDHIVTITEASEHIKMLREGKIELSLNEGVTFSKVRLNPSTGYDEFVVVGSPTMIMEKANKNTKQLLKG
mgnify:CR=1 FL=1|tara:strand:- start:290 stop:565 length:276 start_codon:yes stop_codon:yes gene_type:complete